MPNALISTLVPISGGVPQMALFIADTLHERGIEPIFAYYQPYSLAPELSVPLHRLLTQQVGCQHAQHRGYHGHAIGAWLPELEFTHYHPTGIWRELIDQHDFHLAVSGNCLAATPYVLSKTRFWAWVATDWAEDRVRRVQRFNWYRKAVDRMITVPGARRLEKKILTSAGTIVALSQHTKNRLNNLGAKPPLAGVMPMGIDTEKFSAINDDGERPPTIGFAGRLDDPRKNIDLLLQALMLCRRKNKEIRAVLIGGGDKGLRGTVSEYELDDAITIVDYIDNEKLPEYLNQLDVFVIPSHQEGLCIAALEAMSCGVPVISTRCGGPEEFVIDGETGYLVDFSPALLADRILDVVSDTDAREQLSINARHLIEQRYSTRHAKQTFWASFSQTFHC